MLWTEAAPRFRGALVPFDNILFAPKPVANPHPPIWIGGESPQARDHNLYVLSWMTNVRFCLERGIARLQTGQTAYASKMRFGSRLDKSWVYFKHRGRVVNSLFRTFGPLMAFDRMDPDLAALAKKKPASTPLRHWSMGII